MWYYRIDMPETSDLARAFLRDENGSLQMAVNGSIVPHRYTWVAPGAGKAHLRHVIFNFTMETNPPRAELYGNLLELANGTLLSFRDPDDNLLFGGTYPLKSNAHFLRIAADPVVSGLGSRFMQLVFREPHGLTLNGGDYVAVDIHDDLTDLVSHTAFITGILGATI